MPFGHWLGPILAKGGSLVSNRALNLADSSAGIQSAQYEDDWISLQESTGGVSQKDGRHNQCWLELFVCHFRLPDSFRLFGGYTAVELNRRNLIFQK